MALEQQQNVRTFVGCGRAQLNTKIVIVHPESLTRCAPDEVGEIWVSCPSVAQGYWNRPEETERTFRAYQEPLNRAGRNLEGYDGTLAELSASDGQAQRRFQSYDDPIEIQKAVWLNRCALTHALSGNPDKAVAESRQAGATRLGAACEGPSRSRRPWPAR